MAPELFHRTAAAGFEGSYVDFASVMPHMRALTDKTLASDIEAAFGWFAADAGAASLPVGAVGYCMGGRVATLAALTVALACGVSYYGGGIAPDPFSGGLLDRLRNLEAPMLFFWGGLDQHISPEQVRAVTSALRAANRPYVNVEFSRADHGFFCDARPSYHAEAARQSWALTLAFLDDHLAGRAHPART
jgi:carboxymethylenebutenolidase